MNRGILSITAISSGSTKLRVVTSLFSFHRAGSLIVPEILSAQLYPSHNGVTGTTALTVG
jgi:hypothetical protein